MESIDNGDANSSFPAVCGQFKALASSRIPRDHSHVRQVGGICPMPSRGVLKIGMGRLTH